MRGTDHKTDESLLRDYVSTSSEEAFRELVARYVGLVHGAARRQMREAQMADDVTQAVFILLARKAKAISNPSLLPAWLVRVTHFACRDARKREMRRKRHEGKAAAMNAATQTGGGPTGIDSASDAATREAMLSLLDSGLARLRESDRAVVTLRFLQGRSMADVGAVVGVSEAAAAKRVGRALAKLRAFFSRRGIIAPVAGLGLALAAEGAKAAAANAELVAKVSGYATVAARGVISGAAAGTSTSFAIAKGTGELMAIAKLKTAAVVLSLAVAAVGGGATIVHYAHGQRPGLHGNSAPLAVPLVVAPVKPTAAPVNPSPVNTDIAPVQPTPIVKPVAPPPAKANDALVQPKPVVKPIAPPPAPVTPPKTLDSLPPAHPANGQGWVGGTVKLDGKPPVMPVIDMSGVPQCAQQHAGQTVTEQTVVVGPNGGLANVVISIKRVDGTVLPPPTQKAADAVLDQQGCLYHPHVLAMQAGQKLIVKNSDPFLHNVHSQSETDPFNFAQPMVGAKRAPTPKEAEYFHVKCDVHPWMSAWIAVVDTPYFAVTDESGHFTLPAGLPDGDYAVVAWHEKYDAQEARLIVEKGTGQVDFVFKARDEK